MSTLIGVILAFSLIWLIGMYFILRRLVVIRKRTEKRLADFDSEYTFPTYKSPWIFSVFFGVISYFLSVLVIIFFLK